ncbi:hypothetical protein [Spirosoma utsteinense]|uniref:Uncharacterized protein n=1 Tax=Spirosoma utsteinense TaxID=2585773 RepID=A0ABR6WCZ1_9BACT|nr:hypothetical protein [Spirosoma utsteinense]MBC3788203.1 hypothetical protein [Spirosoma utsteinense]MBC3794164.1 hypothetical protein [Spirosoma utsteinense]
MSASTFRLSTVDTAILDQLPDGVACYEAIRNTAGVITNFQQTYCNSLFEQLAPPA